MNKIKKRIELLVKWLLLWAILYALTYLLGRENALLESFVGSVGVAFAKEKFNR